jgi:hypothetical protein
MKKLVVFVFLLLIIVACKKETTPVSKKSFVTTPVCINLDDYKKLTTVAEKADWLRLNGKYVCKDSLYAYNELHLVDSTKITIIPGKSSVKMKWGQLDSFFGCSVYNAYVSFKIDEARNVKALILVPLYNVDTFCYSIPLFQGIAEKYKFESTTEIEFLMTEIEGNESMVIRFKDSKMWVYYDYSLTPS